MSKRTNICLSVGGRVYSLRYLLSGLLFVMSIGGKGAATAAPPTNQEMEASLTCQCSCGLTVHNCNHLQCGFAIPAKEQIAEQLEQGQSRQAILASFTARYGEKVLSAPTAAGFNLAAWVTPFLVVFIGAVSIGFIVLRWTKRRPQAHATSPSPTPISTANPYQERLKKELETFES